MRWVFISTRPQLSPAVRPPLRSLPHAVVLLQPAGIPQQLHPILLLAALVRTPPRLVAGAVSAVVIVVVDVVGVTVAAGAASPPRGGRAGAGAAAGCARAAAGPLWTERAKGSGS